MFVQAGPPAAAHGGDMHPPLASIRLVRVAYIPTFIALGSLVIWHAGRGRHLALALTFVAAIGVSFAAERVAPYDPGWNRDHDDGARDIAHALVNEALNVISVAALPLLASTIVVFEIWPTGWAFPLQVALAVIVFDAGVTLAHWASHRHPALWSFHAVHHSVTRFYGLNGLMKHPVHQAIEMTAGVAVLVLIGLPQPVAVALAGLTLLQLLLQHSNVDYRVGPLGAWWALNAGHRLHHLRYPGEGDTNFGLYTLLWDRALGTYTPHTSRPVVTTDDMGVAGRPDYPTAYAAQLAEPFRGRRLQRSTT